MNKYSKPTLIVALLALALAAAQGGPQCSDKITICANKMLTSQFLCCADGVAGGGTGGTCCNYVCKKY